MLPSFGHCINMQILYHRASLEIKHYYVITHYVCETLFFTLLQVTVLYVFFLNVSFIIIMFFEIIYLLLLFVFSLLTHVMGKITKTPEF